MDLVGKTLCDETGEEYVVLKLINYKAIKCAYAVSVKSDEKKIFQVSGNGLISIDSKKMINDIDELLGEKFKIKVSIGDFSKEYSYKELAVLGNNI